MTTPPDPRAQARTTRTADIVAAARRQLGEVGPSALSLRSVARELGIAPSAVYRYFSGRDHLLTALVLEGYQGLGAAVVQADEALRCEAVRERWRTVWLTARGWALEHPHEYALLYGSPVLGYAAPAETTGPATLVVGRLARVALDARALGLSGPLAAPAPGPGLAQDVEGVLGLLPGMGLEVPEGLPGELVLEVLAAWTTLFGALSFELFGHYANSVEHPEEHLRRLADVAADRLGLPD